ncbi:MAG TPA: hypothetical protein VG847_16335 [Chitinophagaceae bacterium]|nr:hypothetical protein [Chitinophagaceae bacterium]
MTQIALQQQIQRQIAVIKKVNSEVRKTNESAVKFLKDVGAIEKKESPKPEVKKKK